MPYNFYTELSVSVTSRDRDTGDTSEYNFMHVFQDVAHAALWIRYILNSMLGFP